MYLLGQPQGKPKTANIEIPLYVTLEDLYNGANVEVDVSKHIICHHCFGSGAHSSDSIRTCSSCNGLGTTLKQVQLAPGFVQQFQQQCDSCSGRGKTITQTCKECNGHKTRRGNEQYTVVVDKGMTTGQTVVSKKKKYLNLFWKNIKQLRCRFLKRNQMRHLILIQEILSLSFKQLITLFLQDKEMTCIQS